MPKKHPTFMHFRQMRKMFDGFREIPVNDDGTPELRPGSFLQGETTVDWTELAETVNTHSTPEATFFLDAAFVGRKEYPDELWDALLARRIVFTPEVWTECQDWFNTPFAHRRFHASVVEARAKGSDHIVWLDPSKWTDEMRLSAGYYIALIGARKLIGSQLKERFEKLHGHEPSENELIGQIQKYVGDRGLTLAMKGLEDIKERKATFFADEELVVLALCDAILTGRETYVWTQDPDAIEQT